MNVHMKAIRKKGVTSIIVHFEIGEILSLIMNSTP